MRIQKVIGVDAEGMPIAGVPEVLAETNETNSKSLEALKKKKVEEFDLQNIDRQSYVIWVTPTPPVRREGR